MPIFALPPELDVVLNFKGIEFCLLLNVVQSVELNAPLFVAEAVGTFNVITGVDDPFVTVELKSVPVVPNVNALTLETVPPDPLADKTPVVSFNAKPAPRVISPGVPAVKDLFPSNVFVDMFWILA